MAGFAIANGTINASDYFDACDAGSFDLIACDVYASAFVIDSTILNKFQTLADSNGLPLALWEFNGNTDTSIKGHQTQAQVTSYFNAVNSLFSARIAASKPCGDVLLFDHSDGTDNSQFIKPGDFRISLMRSIFDAVNGASTGISITTSSLAGGTQGSAYSRTVTASGGTSPDTWSISAGALPAGLSLASGTGVISGTPPTAGTGSFTVKVTDHAGNTASKPLSITIASNLAITTSSLTGATQGSPYSKTMAASGGTTPVTWTATASLPPGLSLSSGGVLSGTPTGSGSQPIGFKVTDHIGSTATRSLTLTITASGAGPNITTTTLPGGTQAAAYFQPLAAVDGTTPYSWSVFTGSLPRGLSLSPAGQVSGSPTIAGTFAFTAQVTDAAGLSDTQPLSITVASNLALATTALVDATVSVDYASAVTATGGTPPDTFAVTAGTLSAGLVLNTDGTVTGTPTVIGQSSFSVAVTDSLGSTATGPLTINVDPAGPTVPPGAVVVPGPAASVLAAVCLPQPSVAGHRSGRALFSVTSQPVLPSLVTDGVWMSQFAVLDAEVAVTGQLGVTTPGFGLAVAEGANAKQGAVTLTAGSAVVANTSVTAVSRILLTAQDNSTTGTLRISARTPGVSFTITSSAGADSGLVAYFITEPS